MRSFENIRSLWAASFSAAVCLSLCVGAAFAEAQQTAVTGQVEISRRNLPKEASTAGNVPDASNVVVWLMPLNDAGASPVALLPPQQRPQLVQRNKSFEPHVLVVQVGSTVQFPNRDPFFHNVFSLFDGKRFDLGLYEGGSTNSARFERPGISFLFCNIHPEMSAVVVAVGTPYFAVSERTGHLTIPNVPEGRYLMHVWYERSSPDDLKNLDRTVTVSSSARSLPPIQVVDNGDYKLAHKNKYGQDYVPTATPAYSHP